MIYDYLPIFPNDVVRNQLCSSWAWRMTWALLLSHVRVISLHYFGKQFYGYIVTATETYKKLATVISLPLLTRNKNFPSYSYNNDPNFFHYQRSLQIKLCKPHPQSTMHKNHKKPLLLFTSLPLACPAPGCSHATTAVEKTAVLNWAKSLERTLSSMNDYICIFALLVLVTIHLQHNVPVK